ncbi:hypothetical protein BHE74_00009210, partial [Ensete ventricosum]
PKRTTGERGNRSGKPKARPEQEGSERSREGGDRVGGCGNGLVTLISSEKPPSLASSGAPGSEVEGVVTKGDEGREGAFGCPDRIVGSHVWTEDSDVAWLDGEVLEVIGDEVKICCTDEKVKERRKRRWGEGRRSTRPATRDSKCQWPGKGQKTQAVSPAGNLLTELDQAKIPDPRVTQAWTSKCHIVCAGPSIMC